MRGSGLVLLEASPGGSTAELERGRPAGVSGPHPSPSSDPMEVSGSAGVVRASSSGREAKWAEDERRRLRAFGA